MTLEAKNCIKCGAPLKTTEKCGYCGTIFEFTSNSHVEESKAKPDPWKPYMTEWMGEGHFIDALHYEPEYPDAPTLVCAYRGDGPEITIREEGIAPEATVGRLTQEGRIIP